MLLTVLFTAIKILRHFQPGTPNPTVSLHVTTLTNPSAVVDVPHPAEIRKFGPLLSAVSWADSDHLTAVWMNRVQNQSFILLCETTKSSCRNVGCYSLSLNEIFEFAVVFLGFWGV